MPHGFEIDSCKNCNKRFCYVCELWCPECGTAGEYVVTLMGEEKPSHQNNAWKRHTIVKGHEERTCTCYTRNAKNS